MRILVHKRATEIPPVVLGVIYSFRKVISNYTGYCIKVRRSSDNTTQDIGFVDDVLDVSSLLTFVGGGNGYIHTWYDQLGDGENATQTDTTKQPIIVSSGVVDVVDGYPCAYFNSLVDMIHSARHTALNISTFIVIEPYSQNTADPNNAWRGIFSVGGDVGHGFSSFSRGNAFWKWGTWDDDAVPKETSANSIITDKGVVYLSMVGTTSGTFYKNGVSDGSYGSTKGQDSHIGGEAKTSNQWIHARIFEIISYFSDKSSERSTIENDINDFYKIRAVSDGITYNGTFTRIISCDTGNSGTLTIIETVTEIYTEAFNGCSGYSSLSLPSGWDTAIYGNFSFADFSGASLDASISNLADGTSGTHKQIILSATGYTNLLGYNATAVTDAAARYIDVVSYPSGLVNLWELDEVRGALVWPTRGSVIGTALGHTINQTGKCGKAYSLSGISSSILFPDVGLTTITISLWYYIATGHGNASYDRIFGFTNYNFDVGVYGTGFCVYDGAWHTGLGTFTLDAWHHVVIAKSATGYVFYVNNVAIYSPTKARTINATDDLYIGAAYNGSNIKGLFDQVAIFNVQLNSTEVGILYNSGNGLHYK